jgi:hypothetical protein
MIVAFGLFIPHPPAAGAHRAEQNRSIRQNLRYKLCLIAYQCDHAKRETGNAAVVHPGSDQGPLTNGHRLG